MTVTIEVVTGADRLALIDALAALRLSIFRAWPYLYEGDEAYEKKYLRTYVENDEALVVVARAAGEIIGASTGIPLAAEPPEVRAAFDEATVAASFYGGETVLSPAWRGRGLYRQFLHAREEHAARHGFAQLVFCGVLRDPDHPARPEDFIPLDDVWRHLGYAPCPGARAQMSWRDLGESGESVKTMQFWSKPLAGG